MRKPDVFVFLKIQSPACAQDPSLPARPDSVTEVLMVSPRWALQEEQGRSTWCSCVNKHYFFFCTALPILLHVRCEGASARGRGCVRATFGADGLPSEPAEGQTGQHPVPTSHSPAWAFQALTLPLGLGVCRAKRARPFSPKLSFWCLVSQNLLPRLLLHPSSTH